MKTKTASDILKDVLSKENLIILTKNSAINYEILLAMEKYALEYWLIDITNDKDLLEKFEKLLIETKKFRCQKTGVPISYTITKKECLELMKQAVNIYKISKQNGFEKTECGGEKIKLPTGSEQDKNKKALNIYPVSNSVCFCPFGTETILIYTGDYICKCCGKLKNN